MLPSERVTRYDDRMPSPLLFSVLAAWTISALEVREEKNYLMKHATAETLSALAPLLQELRKRERLVERTPGAFYLRSKAFLHFHDDISGIYADVKLDFESFTRLRVTSDEEQKSLLSSIDEALARVAKK